MKRWRIAVGSVRRPKLDAVRDAISQIAALFVWEAANASAAQNSVGLVSTEVTGHEVDSGVSLTPISRLELMQGARQRAEALQAKLRAGAVADFYVGLEGGLEVTHDNGTRHVFLESWAYVSDGQCGHFGCGGSIELPDALADEVLHRGAELGTAIDHYAGADGIRDGEGAWGVLSGGLMTRCDSFRLAVIAAFAPFYNTKMYRAASTTASRPAPLSAPAATTSRG